MTVNHPGAGTQLGRPLLEQVQSGGTDTGVQEGTPQEDTELPFKVGSATVSPAAGKVKTGEGDVQVERGTGANAQTETYGFKNGQAPTETLQPSAAQNLAQQQALQLEQAKHPPASPKPNRNFQNDVMLMDKLHKMATDLLASYKGLNGPPPEVQAQAQKWIDQATSLSEGLVQGDTYGGNETQTAGPATQSVPQAAQGATSQQQPNPLAPPQPGAKLTDHSIRDQFLQQAGGDKNKARQLAQQAGWSL